MAESGRIGNPLDDDDFAEVHGAMAEAYQRAGVPMIMHLDVTYRCDLDCQHCYLDNKLTWPELNPQEMHNLLEQLHEAGTLFLVWSGGEVFLRPDFAELLTHAAKLGFFSRIKTHGGNLTAERVELLRTSRVSRVDLSLYSLDPAIHDGVTRRAGSLAATLAGLVLLRAAGIPVKVNVVVLAVALAEIPALWQFLEAQGVDFRFYTHVFRDHSGSTALDHLDLTAEQRVRAETAIHKMDALRSRPLPISARAEPTPCKAGRTSGYVSPDGSVWPCVSWPMALGNVRDARFQDIWSGSAVRQEILAWTNDKRTTCMGCAGSGLCTYCPGEGFKTTGDWRQAPASFHAVTRDKMLAWEQGGGERFAPEAWASVPSGGAPVPRPDRFVFPIHRPVKSRGQRVGPAGTREHRDIK